MTKPTQFDEFDDFDQRDENRPEACLVCEALCSDAVDGTLTEAERRAFDKHVSGCAHCAQELDEAQRGAAWLGLLKSKTPEPPASLLTRILAETTGALQPPSVEAEIDASQPVFTGMPAGPVHTPLPALAVVQPRLSPGSERVISFPPVALPSVGDGQEAVGNRSGNVLSFRRLAGSFSSFSAGRGLHPRLAMTAAMAFFSIALTLNLTGVRLRDVRLSNLEPAALQRSAAEAEATAVRSFQNLKVVYQVESRVSELRQDPMWTDNTRPAAKAAGAKPQGQDNTTDGRGQN